MPKDDNQSKGEDYCAKSERVDGKKHSWKFDGDDPYVICYYCNETRDALSGRKIGSGTTTPVPTSENIKSDEWLDYRFRRPEI